jgi:transcriptional regulator with XRE-family HTH domain
MLLQKLRLQHGWSQEQLADLSGVSVRTIQRLEQGKPAATETLKNLGAVLNVPFHDLRTSNMDTTETYNDPQRPIQNLDTDELMALRYARKLRGFYVHAIQFCFVILVMAVINYFTSSYPWVLWTVFGWGSGLLVHGLLVFDKIPFLGAAWEKRVVEERLGRKL